MRTDAKPTGTHQMSSADSHLGSNSGNKTQAIEKALAQLGEAAAQKKVEHICSAYLSLRNAARGMILNDLIALANEALKVPVMPMVVSAFSHRRCFMCSNGTVGCDLCEGAGDIEAGRICPQCDGFGVTPCGFCRGTGWPDHDTIPSEIKATVRERHVVHANRDLQKLAEAFPRLLPEEMEKVPLDQKNSAASWLMRLQSRLIDLIENGIVPEDEQTRYGSIADQIDRCLAALRRLPPPPDQVTKK